MPLVLILFTGGMFAAGFWVFTGMLRRVFGWQSRKALARPVPAHWTRLVRERVPLSAQLTRAEFTRLLAKTLDLVDTRHWEGCAGLVLTEEMQVTIAAQAALLVLEHSGDPYPALDTILLYPSTFRPRRRSWTPSADSEPEPLTLGESWKYGVVILSWDSVEDGLANPADGQNVAVHEFAHQLDMASGTADGTPTLRSAAVYTAWSEMLARDFERLMTDEDAGRESVLDFYGTTNPAEFFAVASEAFFERPRPLQQAYPELYAALAEYYRQDPASRAPAADAERNP